MQGVWRDGAATKPKPLIFDHRFHGCDLDKTNTKEINGSDPNFMVCGFGF